MTTCITQIATSSELSGASSTILILMTWYSDVTVSVVDPGKMCKVPRLLYYGWSRNRYTQPVWQIWYFCTSNTDLADELTGTYCKREAEAWQDISGQENWSLRPISLYLLVLVMMLSGLPPSGNIIQKSQSSFCGGSDLNIEVRSNIDGREIKLPVMCSSPRT